MVISNRIIPWWTTEHTQLQYNEVSFNNEADLINWKLRGFLLKERVGARYIVKKQDYEWIQPFYSLIDGKNIEITFFRMSPGDILPYHSDSYKFYKELYNIKDSCTISRTIIFLENWKAGHILEVEHKPIVQWSAGDLVTWNNDAPHMAANLGDEFRYTVQITFTTH